MRQGNADDEARAHGKINNFKIYLWEGITVKNEAIARVKESTADWEYMKNLPEVVYDFQLRRLLMQDEDTYNLYEYANDSLHRSATVYYHAETDEYKLRLKIGSFEFCYEECISSSLEDFEKLLRTRFDEILHSMTMFNYDKIELMLKKTDLFKWDFASLLPEHIEDFELFVRPSQPLRITNGSYVIIDYECFAMQSNFAVYYNYFRDEYFSDARIAGTPDINYEFDSQTLKDLQEKLSNHLKKRLQAILESAKKELAA